MSLFFVVGFAILIGFALIFATSLSGKKAADGIGTLQTGALPHFDRFVRICRDILEAHKLDISEVHENAETQSVDIYCENPKPLIGGRLLAHCTLRAAEDVTSAAAVVELSSAIIQDRLCKGIFITTGQFTPELGAISELAPMAFIDGKELERLCHQQRIPLIVPN